MSENISLPFKNPNLQLTDAKSNKENNSPDQRENSRVKKILYYKTLLGEKQKQSIPGHHVFIVSFVLHTGSQRGL